MKEFYSMEEVCKQFDTIQKLYEFTNRAQTGTEEDKFFVRHFQLHLAESLVYDFGNENVKKLAHYLLAIINNDPDY